MDIHARLLELAAQGNKQFAATLNPGVENVLGIRVPQLRLLAKEIAKGDWQGYLATADTFYMEDRMLQGLVIAYIKGIPLEQRLELLRRFIPVINSWSVCDSVCSTFNPSAKEREVWWDFLLPYFASEQEYEVRFAVVFSMDEFIDQQHLPLLLEWYASIHHPGYYVKMAVAWAVSFCYVKFPQETEQFLKQQLLDEFTHNKAIQKICESLRADDAQKASLKALKR